MKKTRIALFGAGNLGKRYLQALSKVKNIEVAVFDISENALSEIKHFLQLSKCFISNLKILKYDDILRFINEETIVISASTANERIKQLKEISRKTPRGLIVEKPVVQLKEEYDKLIETILKNNINTYVNFTLRVQPFYVKLKKEIEYEKSGTYNAHLPNMGLICVGIHHIDIFQWLFKLDKLELTNCNISAVCEQKRKGFYDICGSFSIQSNDFNAYIYNSKNTDVRCAQVITKHAVYNYNEDQKLMATIDAKRNESHIENIEYLFVSQYMTEIINNIIEEKYYNIDLPSIIDSYNTHRIIFNALKENKLENLNYT